MSMRISRSISKQVSMYLSYYVLLSCLLAVLFLSWSEKENLTKQFHQFNQSTINMMAYSVIEPLLMDDYPVLNDYAQALINENKHILALTIVGTDGVNVVSLSSLLRQDNQTHDMAQYSQKISLPGSQGSIGTIHIDVSKDYIHNLIVKRVRLIGIALLVILTFL